MLTTKNIDIYYGKKKILHGIDLSLEKNDRLLLAGPNGAGKSTLLKCIAGLIPSSKGEIHLNQQIINHQDIKKRVKLGISYLLQTNNVFQNMTIKDNLDIAGFYLSKREYKNTLDSITKLFPILKSQDHKLAAILSGGERQMLAISMVLMTRPKILLLDEPLAGLSPTNSQKILDALVTLQNDGLVQAICIVEHSLKTIMPWSNKLIVLKQGRTVLTTQDIKPFEADTSTLENIFLS